MDGHGLGTKSLIFFGVLDGEADWVDAYIHQWRI
jgi:hypothetical protein